jgi:glycosyltransferase involved in cell wall biosynthesis
MANKVKIVLLSMVKNEQANIVRLFSSVKDWIDGIVLCDTGSTDTTVSVAKKAMEEMKIPGRIYQYPWENFGKSRSKSFECLKDWVVRFTEWDPKYVFGLLLDADMVLTDGSQLHTALEALDLSYSGANIKQQNGGLIYQNTRFLRASDNWKCIGATHEYWGCDGGKPIASFDTPVITDIGDGGCKGDKYTRDAKLLEDELLVDPNNVRTLFYLGQTYMSLNRNEDAIRVLTKRIELKGWEEEMYIAQLYKGDCLKNLGRIAEATEEWLKAWQIRPHRTEGAMRLISYYRQQPNMNFISYMYLEKLIQIQLGETVEGKALWKPSTHKDILFVSNTDMKYQVWEELGITAFYVGRNEAARYRLDKQVMISDLGFHQHNRLLELYRWYTVKFPVVKRVHIKVTPEDVPFFSEGYWRAFNPCIRLDGDRYVISMRTANYETNNAHHYTYRGKEGLIITRNVVADLDADFNILHDRREPMEIVIPDEVIVNRNTNIIGVEDCRWLSANSVIATSRQFNSSNTNRMIRVDFDYDTRKVTKVTPLSAPVLADDTDCQKNWLPFIYKGQEVFIYKINPYLVYSIKGEKLVEWKNTSKITFDGLRGSGMPVPWASANYPQERLILVAHFSHYGQGSEGRRYYHRFITLDEGLIPVRISTIVTLADEAVQYVAGICMALKPKNYVLSYGINDSQAWAVEVEGSAIEASLTYTLF